MLGNFRCWTSDSFQRHYHLHFIQTLNNDKGAPVLTRSPIVTVDTTGFKALSITMLITPVYRGRGKGLIPVVLCYLRLNRGGYSQCQRFWPVSLIKKPVSEHLLPVPPNTDCVKGKTLALCVSEDFDWRNVIFSDEVIVSNSNDSTAALVYCMIRYDERFVRRIINKSGCVRVACWGWMLYNGAGLLERIHGRFTAEVCEHILANVMIPSARKRYPEGTLFFQQDNHPIRTANRIQRWFTRRRDVDPDDRPPNSPDMNPVQHLWVAVKRILRSNWAE
ncbi:hypothetical protein ANN_10190 [Periplaneta americana]|uniref:Tc1-like transposase DDE domain-containing protein n=1 Tax=Periplaneta americana TaxID=6978 RepID=A0ABQ8TQ77_PERAM|nr:hypothetical protein ANN_10190 [Periplaneta americana]